MKRPDDIGWPMLNLFLALTQVVVMALAHNAFILFNALVAVWCVLMAIVNANRYHDKMEKLRCTSSRYLR